MLTMGRRLATNLLNQANVMDSILMAIAIHNPNQIFFADRLRFLRVLKNFERNARPMLRNVLQTDRLREEMQENDQGPLMMLLTWWERRMFPIGVLKALQYENAHKWNFLGALLFDLKLMKYALSASPRYFFRSPVFGRFMLIETRITLKNALHLI